MNKGDKVYFHYASHINNNELNTSPAMKINLTDVTFYSNIGFWKTTQVLITSPTTTTNRMERFQDVWKISKGIYNLEALFVVILGGSKNCFLGKEDRYRFPIKVFEDLFLQDCVSSRRTDPRIFPSNKLANKVVQDCLILYINGKNVAQHL